MQSSDCELHVSLVRFADPSGVKAQVETGEDQDGSSAYALGVSVFEFLAGLFVELGAEFDGAVRDDVLVAILVEDNLEQDEQPYRIIPSS